MHGLWVKEIAKLFLLPRKMAEPQKQLLLVELYWVCSEREKRDFYILIYISFLHTYPLTYFIK